MDASFFPLDIALRAVRGALHEWPMDSANRYRGVALGRNAFAALALASLGALSAFADSPPFTLWHEEVGYNQLKNAVGSALPTGAGVAVSQVEAYEGGSRYFIDTSWADFSGLTLGQNLIDGSGGAASGTSSHATYVGSVFFGNDSSVAPDANNVTMYQVDNWLNDYLRVNAGDPVLPAFQVQNHSWVGTLATPTPPETSVPPTREDPLNVQALRRFDYMLDAANGGKGFTAVVGLNNDLTPIPYLMSHSYNAIVVGRTDGNHSTGFTLTYDGTPPDSTYGPGRSKPDIVAPRPTAGGPPFPRTSYATPMVGSAAAMMYQTVSGTEAEHSEVIKAILLAGATKKEFEPPLSPTYAWNRTHDHPLDDTFGAGELNVYNAYLMAVGGRKAGASSPALAAPAPASGWDYKTFKDVRPAICSISSWCRPAVMLKSFPSSLLGTLKLRIPRQVRTRSIQRSRWPTSIWNSMTPIIPFWIGAIAPSTMSSTSTSRT